MSSEGALLSQDLLAQEAPVAQPQSAREALEDLQHLLALEKDALVRLDRDAIEAFAVRKLELDTALKAHVASVPLSALDKDLLQSVRQAALSNQLLLAHARSCVQGVLSLLAPVNAPGYTASGHAPSTGSNPPPLALNLRR